MRQFIRHSRCAVCLLLLVVIALPSCARIKEFDEVSVLEVESPVGLPSPVDSLKSLTPGHAVVSGGGTYQASGVRAQATVGELKVPGAIQTGTGVSAISGIHSALQQDR